MSSFMMTGITDPGCVRDINEDAYLISTENRLAVLADGMGGHLAGEIASAIAVEVVTRELARVIERLATRPEGSELPSITGALATAIVAANQAIIEAARVKPGCEGLGTTVVVALLYGGKLYAGHVGDSRLYRLRGGTLTQLTEDHSMVQEMIRRGFITPEEARTSASKNLVTRALGVEAQVEPDVAEHDCDREDLYFLCSDGVTDVLTDSEIESVLSQRVADPEHALQRMVDEVNRRGGPDNITAILIRVGHHAGRAAGMHS
jgi:protein phosphatase